MVVPSVETELMLAHDRIAELKSQRDNWKARALAAEEALLHPVLPDTDTTKCPGCGGPATNGTDRCVPPQAYYCDRCEDNVKGERHE